MENAVRVVGFLLPLVLFVCGGSHKQPTTFVLDQEHVLTSAQVRSLDSLFRVHEHNTMNEIVLITHPTFNGTSAKEFAVMTGNSLGVGKREFDNGVVIAFSKARREMFIATGSGTEQVLHDSICKRIIDEEMTPRFRHGDTFTGLWQGSLAVVRFLELPENQIR